MLAGGSMPRSKGAVKQAESRIHVAQADAAVMGALQSAMLQKLATPADHKEAATSVSKVASSAPDQVRHGVSTREAPFVSHTMQQLQKHLGQPSHTDSRANWTGGVASPTAPPAEKQSRDSGPSHATASVSATYSY